jgi:hypothetical protein
LSKRLLGVIIGGRNAVDLLEILARAAVKEIAPVSRCRPNEQASG